MLLEMQKAWKIRDSEKMKARWSDKKGAKVKVEPSLKKSEKYFCMVLSCIVFSIENNDQVD